MNSPHEEHVSDAQLSHEINLVEKYWDEDGNLCEDCNHCRVSEKADYGMRITQVECRVLTQDLDLTECPAFEGLVEDEQRKMQDEAEADRCR